MAKAKKKTISFDPGFARYYPRFDDQIVEFNNITLIKNINQRKFKLQMIENSLIRPLNTLTAIYYGCVVYGSLVASRYNDPMYLIKDNPVNSMSEEEKKSVDLTEEPKYVLELYRNFNKSIEFHFRRQTKLPEKLPECVDLYIEFITLNNHFKELKAANQIILPEKTQHFQNYSDGKLKEIERSVKNIIQSGELDKIFNIS